MKMLSAQAIQTTIQRLSDPDVNFRLDLASTPHVARRIIQSLPGVKELSENGPDVEEALLAVLQDEEKLQDDRLASISLHILENYPSERVKVALAKPIAERRFTGFNSQFAAETFLKAAGIETLRKDAVAIALREARKIQEINAPKMNILKSNTHLVDPKKIASPKKPAGKMGRKLHRKGSLAAKK